MTMNCDLVLPCRDEAAAWGPAATRPRRVLGRSSSTTARATAPPTWPAGWGAVVVETSPGYGAAVHAGSGRATADYVAVMDGDGSFDPAALLPLLADVARARRHGRRAAPPAGRGVWPWHARLGNALVAAWLRRRIGMRAHDIAPMRVCRRAGPARPRPARTGASATPSSCCRRVTAPAGGHRARRRLPPAAAGPARRCPARCAAPCGPPATSGGCCRERADRPGARQGTGPRAGQDPARAVIGDDASPPTSRRPRCSTRWTPARGVRRRACHLALTGDLADSPPGREIRAALAGWTVTPQRGRRLAERLAHAHADAAGRRWCRSAWTPRSSPPRPAGRGRGLRGHDAVLGPARTAAGGRWRSATRRRRPRSAVPMSTPTTGRRHPRRPRRRRLPGRRRRRAPRRRHLDGRRRAVADGRSRTRFARPWPRWRGHPMTAVAASFTVGLRHALCAASPCRVVGLRRRAARAAASTHWTRPADAADLRLLDHCAARPSTSAAAPAG